AGFKRALVGARSEHRPAGLERVVYISGGPGAPLTVYAANQAITPYAPRRDLILVDQRGTGRSEPSLCPDLAGKLLDAALVLAANVAEEALAARAAAYQACHDQAIDRGFDLSNFGTTVTADECHVARR